MKKSAILFALCFACAILLVTAPPEINRSPVVGVIGLLMVASSAIAIVTYFQAKAKA